MNYTQETNMIEKGYFNIELNDNERLDLADLSKADWREVDRRAKQILLAKQTTNTKIAFLAGFLNYVAEKQAMNMPFDCQH